MIQDVAERFASWRRNPRLHALAVASRSRALSKLVNRLRVNRQANISSRFLLILDCDTSLDIAVVDEVDQNLRNVGIVPVYAAPGEILREGAREFSRIAERGAQFLNHGYRRHTAVDAARTKYTSTFFYHDIPEEEMVADVMAGHDTVVEVIGQNPTAFRAPHFATLTFSPRLSQLQVHLATMGYAYSLSTSPLTALNCGPVVDVNGVVEIPTTGRPSDPSKVLDSWTARFEPDGPRQNYDFLGECRQLSEDLGQGRLSVATIYADPSQVHDWPTFFAALAQLAPYSTSTVERLVTLGTRDS